ncbi:condensation domain-containing protein [Thermocatellispora tengchongensis]|uniref:condensation domain-containing protein n=1 Tax=Thermocatellispora tengchongensis TaxID=1073253 RepID=UPI003633F072
MTADPRHPSTAPGAGAPEGDGDDRRLRLLRALLAQQGAAPDTGPAEPGPAPGRDPEATPLSSAQYRMWFHQQARPGSAAYNLAVAAELTGELDPAALRAGFTAVAARHEILRTVYRTAPDGTPSSGSCPRPRSPSPWRTRQARTRRARTRRARTVTPARASSRHAGRRQKRRPRRRRVRSTWPPRHRCGSTCTGSPPAATSCWSSCTTSPATT